MFEKIKEIAQSWIIAANPTELQKEIATKRYDICLQCPHFRQTRPITHDIHCDSCGCPLEKKIFTPKFDACPEHKWLEIENKYIKSLHKNTKTIV
jgi:hypothetical protein